MNFIGSADACRPRIFYDLIDPHVGQSKRETKDMVKDLFEEIRLALEQGDSVRLSGSGNFRLRDKPERPGRNPKPGEEIPISARQVVTLHASQKLKTAVKQLSDARSPEISSNQFPPIPASFISQLAR